MNKAKDYIQLHLNILLFSLTSVFSKAASVQLNRGGIKNPLLYVFLFLMVANCGIYAIAWQKVIKKFSLSTAYANRSVYLIWSQIWAVLIFHENLTVKNTLFLQFHHQSINRNYDDTTYNPFHLYQLSYKIPYHRT